MTAIINEAIVLRLNSNILKRFEHNLQDGIMILYDVERGEIWFGNSSSRELINMIDGNTNLKSIYANLLPLYEGEDIADILESFNYIILDLYNKNFIEQA